MGIVFSFYKSFQREKNDIKGVVILNHFEQLLRLG